MTTGRFPLTEALGVQVRAMSNYYESKYVVYVADLEAALAAAPVASIMDCVEDDLTRPISIHCYPNADKALANARIVCVQPIEADSPEKLVREILNGGFDAAGRVTHGWMKRARRLLAKD